VAGTGHRRILDRAFTRDVRGPATQPPPQGAGGAARHPAQEAWLTVDMLKSPTRMAGIAVRVK
jgi:hypothetical protein